MASLTAETGPSAFVGDASTAERARRSPERRAARWWLAGLLVGCLLPAGLSPLGTATPVARVIQVCILAPALIRASSRLQARRRACRRWPPRRLPRTPRRVSRRPLIAARRHAVAAHDVLTRRGPPGALLA